MTETHKKDMLAKVKQTFLRMASPFEYGGSSLVFDSPLTVNIPPMLARADAAAERFNILLNSNIFQQNDKNRLYLYHELEKLLQEILTNLEEANNYAKSQKCKLLLDDRINLFQYMMSSVRILAGLAAKQAQMDPHFSKLHATAGKAILPVLQKADDILTESEMQICHCLVDFASAAAPVINKMRDACKDGMTKNDFERYSKAYAEYLLFFADFGTIVPETEE